MSNNNNSTQTEYCIKSASKFKNISFKKDIAKCCWIHKKSLQQSGHSHWKILAKIKFKKKHLSKYSIQTEQIRNLVTSKI